MGIIGGILLAVVLWWLLKLSFIGLIVLAIVGAALGGFATMRRRAQ